MLLNIATYCFVRTENVTIFYYYVDKFSLTLQCCRLGVCKMQWNIKKTPYVCCFTWKKHLNTIFFINILSFFKHLRRIWLKIAYTLLNILELTNRKRWAMSLYKVILGLKTCRCWDILKYIFQSITNERLHKEKIQIILLNRRRWYILFI